MRIPAAVTLALLATAALPALAQQQPAPAPAPAPASAPRPAAGYGSPVTLEVARRVVEAGLMDAQRRNLHMAVAVVDPSGTLVAFGRADGTQTASITVAIEKARSAAMYRRPTKVFEDALAGGRTAILALPGAMPVEGGVPLLQENRIVGAIGVSGGTSQEDGQVAAAALSTQR